MNPYYEHAGITIYHGDCREILPTLPKVDLVLTDPPYGIGMSMNPFRQKFEKSNWDKFAPDGTVISEVVGAADHSILWGGNYFDLPPNQCFLVWDKMQPQNFSSSMCEQAWTNIKMPAKIFRKSVLAYTKYHPTQKPVELMAWCIFVAKVADTILDPFMGSGTTLVAAKQLGRSAIGIEIEEKYCEIAAKRLSQEVLPLVAEAREIKQVAFGLE